MKKITCETCLFSVYYSRNDDNYIEFECHRRCPTKISSNIENFRFPHVFVHENYVEKSDWCGEWAEKTR
ncbi:MAG: hypothetical protein WC346_04720 [Methanogenium sp.]|jgi:hypothetical protein